METLLKPSKVAQQLCVTTDTLATWRRKGSGPPFVKLGNSARAKVRYRPSEVQKYIEEQSATRISDVRRRHRELTSGRPVPEGTPGW